MVTARMSEEKKEEGNRILESLGTNASRVVNELYDYIIRERKLPFAPEEVKPRTYTKEEIQEAMDWLEEVRIAADELSIDRDKTYDELRQEALIARGLATASDFK
jgi:addiction module RelB/DinJ family antitoxin